MGRDFELLQARMSKAGGSQWQPSQASGWTADPERPVEPGKGKRKGDKGKQKGDKGKSKESKDGKPEVPKP